MTTPTWGQQPEPSASGMSARKKGLLGCGGAIVLGVALLAIIGAIIGPSKKTSASAQSSPSASTSPSPSASQSPSVSPRPARASRPAAPAPAKKHISKPTTLAHGAQQGLTNCIIQYADAQKGAGTSTFSTLVLNDSGQPYPPAASATYSVMFQLTVTGADGTTYPVAEAMGSGSRTAADNGGSDWFTTNQGDAEVSANSTEGMVDTTLPIPLAQVKSVQGNIMITSQSDENYLMQKDCAVRPA